MRETSQRWSGKESMAKPQYRETRNAAFGRSTGSSASDEQILCWCEKVTRDQFREAIWNAPAAQFYDLCGSIGVGTKCTSCLLDAEAAYDEAVRQPAPRTGAVSKRQRADRRGAKRAIYEWLDRLSPRVAIPLRGIVPILTGEGVSTIVTVANSIPRAVGVRSPRFTVRLDVRAADGRKIDSIARTLSPGERLDHEISRWNAHDGLSTGSCRVLTTALEDGYRGSVRPHFTIRTPRSFSTVHSQGNGRRTAFVRTVIHPHGETQYLSVVNCEHEPAAIEVRATRDGEELMTRQVSVPPLGAALVELAVPNAQRDTSRPIVAELKANRLVRTHMVVAAGRPARISLDHV